MSDKNTKLINALSKTSIYNDSLFQKLVAQTVRLADGKSPVENDLLRDAFKLYHRPVLSEKKELPEGRDINKRLLEWAAKSPNFEQSKMTTVNRMMVSSKSAELLTEMLLNDPEVKKAMEEQDKADKLNQQSRQEQQAADDAEEQGDQQGQQQHQAKADQLKQQAKQASQRAEHNLKQRLDNPMMQAVRAAAVKKAQEGGEQVGQIMDGFGMEDGDFQSMTDEEVDAMSDFMKDQSAVELTALLGRVKGIAMQHAATKPNLEVTITDYGRTQDISMMFDSERMNLHPNMPDFIRGKALAELSQGGLQGLKKEVPPKTRGTIIFGKDGSGSMDSNGRNIRAGALSLGIFRAAEETGQEWKAFSFGSRENELSPVIGPESSPTEQLDFARIAAHGGTDFNSALRYAISIVEELPEPDFADIVLITDGEATINDDTRAALKDIKARHGCRFIGIMVDTDSYYKDVQKVSDAYINISKKEDMAKAAEQLSAILWDGR